MASYRSFSAALALGLFVCINTDRSYKCQCHIVYSGDDKIVEVNNQLYYEIALHLTDDMPILQIE